MEVLCLIKMNGKEKERRMSGKRKKEDCCRGRMRSYRTRE